MARLRERSGGVEMPLSSKPGVNVVGHFNFTCSAALTVYITKSTSVVSWDTGESKQYGNASVCKVGVWTRWVMCTAVLNARCCRLLLYDLGMQEQDDFDVLFI
jgi:hypothetical protein